MKDNRYRLFSAFLLGATIALLIFYWADRGRHNERHARLMRSYAELQDVYKKEPVDSARAWQLFEEAIVIQEERENDPWVIRNVLFIIPCLGILGVIFNWLGFRLDRQASVAESKPEG